MKRTANALSTTSVSQALAPLRQRWQALASREQNMILLAGSVLLLALVWWLALAPALHSLRTAPARHAQTERELQNMLQMKAQVEQLRQQPQNTTGDARVLLQQSLTAELGNTAQLQWLGNRAQVNLSAAPAAGLARWLTQVRDNTHASAAEMKLSRATPAGATATGTTGATGATDTTVYWTGSLLLDLPTNDRNSQ